jgi:CBS domain-containing protein
MARSPQETAAPPETLDDDPPITRLMSTHLLAITPDSPLATAMRVMAATGLRHLPVLDGNRCLGLVAEHDVAGFVAGGAGGSGAARASVLVEELTQPADPVPTSARRSEAARRMRAERTDAVLVTHQGRLVGIVTSTDLVRSLAGVEPADAEHANSEHARAETSQP